MAELVCGRHRMYGDQRQCGPFWHRAAIFPRLGQDQPGNCWRPCHFATYLPHLSYRQARRIARPLEELVEASNRIGQLDFSENPVIKRALDSSIQEVRALAVAQEEMRKLLAANQEEIETQPSALQQLAHYEFNP